ncbi:rod-binding protein [Sulfurospirillum barnesii]|uniref:Rod binding protein n=1 Tax=Sulfurospirillum barnesii (strain ATCC 700032 / DSM 10660 / SES-3) TaxID=760154 RepID=I3XWU1_SULBS|nr:rod-binding protein [Sulfurospirillum barnesii]AFL68415.1 Rod binding protein [Sulfurospirillum barnesii SES-3]
MQVDNSIALLNTNYQTPFAGAHSQSSDTLLKEQTDKFEAFFLKQVLDIAMNSEEENGLFEKDAGDKIYKSMYNDTMSSALSGGLGLSEMLFNYLKEGR